MRGAWKPAAHCAVAAVALASPPCSLSLSLSLCSLISQSSRALALALRIAALSRGGSGSAAPARANHAHGHVAGSGGARQVAGARNAAIGPVAAVAHLPRVRPRGPRRLRPAVGWSWWSFTQVRGAAPFRNWEICHGWSCTLYRGGTISCPNNGDKRQIGTLALWFVSLPITHGAPSCA